MGYCAKGRSEITRSRARMEKYGQGLADWDLCWHQSVSMVVMVV